MMLTDKTALVTGAANRLGAQIARTLHQNGANLIIHYRSSASAAMALEKELNQQRAGSASCIAADLSLVDDINRLAEQACASFDGLDLLINNASSFYPTPLGEINEQAWDDLVASNFKAPLFLSQACHAALKKSRGCIINMVDIYASRPLAQHSVYSSAKAANQMLVKSLALEMAPDVRVNGIAPGAILWPATDTAEDEAQQQAILQQVPLKRLGSTKAITDCLLMLAGNDYITGEIIRVDGGRSLT